MDLLKPIFDALPWMETVLMYVGGLYVLGAAYVMLTPTQKDDAWYSWFEKHPILGKIADLLKASSPVQRKK